MCTFADITMVLLLTTGQSMVLYQIVLSFEPSVVISWQLIIISLSREIFQISENDHQTQHFLQWWPPNNCTSTQQGPVPKHSSQASWLCCNWASHACVSSLLFSYDGHVNVPSRVLPIVTVSCSWLHSFSESVICIVLQSCSGVAVMPFMYLMHSLQWEFCFFGWTPNCKWLFVRNEIFVPFCDFKD